MANGNANIDLLFRNGLKDYEVLPPVEIWNNILPAVRKKQRPVILLRSAALIAVLMSLSFLVYRWTSEIGINSRNPTLALVEESSRSQVNNSKNGTVKITGRSKELSENIQNSTPYNKSENTSSKTGNEITEPLNGSGSANNPSSPVAGFVKLETILGVQKFNFQDADGKIGYLDKLKEIPFAEPKEKSGKWSITALASPTYYMNSELNSNGIAKQINSSEQSKISYSGGIAVAYKISKKLSIQSGLYYSSIGNEIDGISSFSGFHQYDYTKGDHNFEVLTSNGLIYTENADVFLLDKSGVRVLTRYTNDVFDPAKANLSYVNNTLYQNFSYLELPVLLKYKLIDKTIDFNLIGGLSYNLLVNNDVNAYIGGTKYPIGKTAGLNSFMVSSSVGMGMEYNITNKISLNLEPTFRYYLNPFSVIPGTRAHPYSIGVFSGLSYKF